MRFRLTASLLYGATKDKVTENNPNKLLFKRMELNKVLLIGDLGIPAKLDFGLFIIDICCLSRDS